MHGAVAEEHQGGLDRGAGRKSAEEGEERRPSSALWGAPRMPSALAQVPQRPPRAQGDCAGRACLPDLACPQGPWESHGQVAARQLNAAPGRARFGLRSVFTLSHKRACAPPCVQEPNYGNCPRPPAGGTSTSLFKIFNHIYCIWKQRGACACAVCSHAGVWFSIKKNEILPRAGPRMEPVREGLCPERTPPCGT